MNSTNYNLQPSFWSVADYCSNDVPYWVANCYQDIVPYIEKFLCAQHPYRKGPVCPFIPSVRKNNMVFFSYIENNIDIENQIHCVKRCVELLLDEKKKGLFGTVIILLHENFEIERLLDIQHSSKRYCVERKLMLGALYPTSNAMSLHSNNFFPLRTPTPTLVIRDMVQSDLMFLNQRKYNINEKIFFLKNYINNFSQTQKASRKNFLRSKKLYLYYWMQKSMLYFLLLMLFFWVFF
ncbi:MAG: hypothetical protein D3918_10305 [Candidatus Electrothrix sp. AX2]|nr:hypothetical protein [Candidatus Electrothrix gigas]